MTDKQTTDGRSSLDAKSAFAEALGLSREVIARAEAGDQDAIKTVYTASQGARMTDNQTTIEDVRYTKDSMTRFLIIFFVVLPIALLPLEFISGNSDAGATTATQPQAIFLGLNTLLQMSLELFVILLGCLGAILLLELNRNRPKQAAFIVISYLALIVASTYSVHRQVASARASFHSAVSSLEKHP
ncbi:hypothetical protein K2X14_14060 [Acetobacter sp. TBRC 12305]|uniref:Uncharacterized protein n=1 Tax=Acetobacter garciniae TaxID=2817435 RepID=A0A939HQR3_9PROT|nr:hypothetical protein [Acetobacter garciniae]MBO1326744.1 hypothetical protein [Acetobacter garciniae]MBX0345958.1 hypothetical protein [Acetobacter garciniae]